MWKMTGPRWKTTCRNVANVVYSQFSVSVAPKLVRLSSTNCNPHGCFWKQHVSFCLWLLKNCGQIIFSGLCVLLLAHKGYRIHYFFAHTFKRVTTNTHSSVLCRLIGKVMDFTDSSRTEPNTSAPFVQRANWLVWTKLHGTTQQTFFFWHFGA